MNEQDGLEWQTGPGCEPHGLGSCALSIAACTLIVLFALACLWLVVAFGRWTGAWS